LPDPHQFGPAEIDAAIEDFEASWSSGVVPAIGDCLHACTGADDEFRYQLLCELIMVDLEWRWRRNVSAVGGDLSTIIRDAMEDGRVSHRPRLEEYVRAFPELLAVSKLPIQLIADEYRVRHCWGDRPTRRAYLERFPAQAAKLQAALARTEALLRPRSPPTAVRFQCPNCHIPVELVELGEGIELDCPSCGSSIQMANDEAIKSKLGSRISHYELIERVGSGAFGTVWRAFDSELHREVAIKICRQRGFSSGDSVGSLLHEARAAAGLLHHNIVTVHQVGSEDGTDYIVSDFVDGMSLHDWFLLHPLDWHGTAKLCACIAEAIHYAHGQGIVHRDIKPSNIMMNEAGEPFLTDFGLAKRESVGVTMTMDGRMLGTPAYMSPEQAQGDMRNVAPPSDIYALGVVLFEMLTGERPFRGDVSTLLHQVVHQDAPRPRDLNASVPRDLETICLKCLEKDPARRYATALELARDLNRFTADLPVAARPITRFERAIRWCKRKPLLASLSTATVVLLLVTAISAVLAYLGQRTITLQQTEIARSQTLIAQQSASFALREGERRVAAEKSAAVARARRLAAESLNEEADNPELGVLLAVESVRQTQEKYGFMLPEAEQALRTGLAGVGGRPIPHCSDAAFSPDGRKIATLESFESTHRLVVRELPGINAIYTREIAQPSNQRFSNSRAFTNVNGTSKLPVIAFSRSGRWLYFSDRAKAWIVHFSDDNRISEPQALDIPNAQLDSERQVEFAAGDSWLTVTNRNIGEDCEVFLYALTDDAVAAEPIRLGISAYWPLLSPSGERLLLFAPDVPPVQQVGTEDLRYVKLFDLRAGDPRSEPKVIGTKTLACFARFIAGDYLVASRMDSQDGPALRAWSPDGDPVRSEIGWSGVTISSDGQWLMDSTRVWKTAGLLDGEELPAPIKTLPMKIDRRSKTALAAGWLFVNVRDANNGMLWDLRDASRIKEIRCTFAESFRSSVISPDGRWLALTHPSSISLVPLTGEHGRSIHHKNSVTTFQTHATAGRVAFSGDGKWLVSFGFGAARLYDLEDLTLGAEPAVERIRVAPRKLFDRLTAEEREHDSEPFVPVRVSNDPNLRKSPDGRWIVGRLGPMLGAYVWDTQSPNGLDWQSLPYARYSEFSFSKDSKRLVGHDERGPSVIVDLDRLQEEPIRLAGEHFVLLSAFGKDADQLFTSSDEGLRYWNLGASEPESQLVYGAEQTVTYLGVGSESKWLITGHVAPGPRLEAWRAYRFFYYPDPNDSPLVTSLRALNLEDLNAPPVILQPPSDGFLCNRILMGKTGKWMATATQTDHSSIERVSAMPGVGYETVFQYQASEEITLWNLSERLSAPVATIKAQADEQLRLLAMDPTERWLVLGRMPRDVFVGERGIQWKEEVGESEVWIWDLANGRLQHRVDVPKPPVGAQFSRDGRALAVQLAGTSLVVWNDLAAEEPKQHRMLTSGEEIALNQAGSRRARQTMTPDIQFSHDNRYLMNGSELWDLSIEADLAAPVKVISGVHSWSVRDRGIRVFTPEMKWLLSQESVLGGWVLKRYLIGEDQLVEAAMKYVGRDLTQGERDQLKIPDASQ